MLLSSSLSNISYLIRQLYGSINDVVVPEMYVEQTTGRVLTMQWVEVVLFLLLFM